MSNDGLVRVRLFQSIEEVRALPGFIENHPVEVVQYEAIIGHTAFGKNQHKCCLLEPKSGKVCGQLHGKGYVVRVKSSAVSIIGQVCGREKFGADGTFAADTRRYDAALQRDRALQSIRAHASKAGEIRASIAAVLTRLENLERRIGKLMTYFEPGLLRKLRDMARSGKSSLSALGIKYRRPEKDQEKHEGPKSKTERHQVHVTTLQALQLFADDPSKPHRDALQRLSNAVAAIETADDSLPLATVTELNNAIVSYANTIERARTFVNLGSRFEENDFGALWCLTKDPRERQGVEFLLRFLGRSDSLDQRETAALRKSNVDRFDVR